jgi:NAD(P)-dependent dehydrogenase (short-subunit alcohol dehydrogenase family)
VSKLFDLTGRVAVVTGGNGGIGFGIASGLSQAGAAWWWPGGARTRTPRPCGH